MALLKDPTSARQKAHEVLNILLDHAERGGLLEDFVLKLHSYDINEDDGTEGHTDIVAEIMVDSDEKAFVEDLFRQRTVYRTKDGKKILEHRTELNQDEH